MTSRFLIYALVDPRTGEWRYIGKSMKGMVRPRQHNQDFFLKTEAHTHKVRWIRELQGLGLQPGIEVLEEFAEPEALSQAECDWIAAARLAGVPLTNLTEGGDGRVGPCSAEHRRKIGDANRGKRRSYETRLKMSQSRKGRRSPNVGRVWSEEYRVKQSQVHGGRPIVDETGRRYETLSDAARVLGCRKSGISQVLRGRAKTCLGHQFRYAEVA